MDEKEKRLRRSGWQFGCIAPILAALTLLNLEHYGWQSMADVGLGWGIAYLVFWLAGFVGSVCWLRTVAQQWKSFGRKPVVLVVLNFLPVPVLVWFLLLLAF